MPGMKAIVCERYGSPDVLEYRDVDRPVPGPGRVLVRIHAASVNAADWHLLRASPFVARLYGGLFRPRFRILGADIAGRIEAVGPGVASLRPGEAVFGDLSRSGFGAFAEYACPRADALLPMPEGLGFAEAAAAPLAGQTALQGLRGKVPPRPGRKVLIHGAGGGVGTFAVQIAKALGDAVTAVCGAGNAERVLALGADRVLDYAREDFASSGDRYDLILGINGYRPLADYRKALAPGGAYVMIGGTNRQMFQALLLGPWVSRRDRRILALAAAPDREDLAFLKGLLESGKVKPVIDRSFPLAETAAAIRYLEAGHARGKVVILHPSA